MSKEYPTKWEELSPEAKTLIKCFADELDKDPDIISEPGRKAPRGWGKSLFLTTILADAKRRNAADRKTINRVVGHYVPTSKQLLKETKSARNAIGNKRRIA